MTNNLKLVLIILLINAVFAVLYLIYGLILRPRFKVLNKPPGKERAVGAEFVDDDYKMVSEDDVPDLMLPEEKVDKYNKTHDRRRYVMLFVVFLLFPVASECMVFLSWILQKLFFRDPVDLSDVVFDKSQKRPMHRGDEERERNLVPLEEALAVTDFRSLRSLMLNILKGDITQSLSHVMMALDSDDSETAHYAASVLSDELNDFRSNVQAVYTYIKSEIERLDSLTDVDRDDPDFDVSELKSDYPLFASALIKYIAAFVSQRVFTEMEEATYGQTMAEVGDILFERNKEVLTVHHYRWITEALLITDDFETCEKWAIRAAVEYPHEMFAYTGRIKLYFKTGRRQQFLEVLEDLKRSDVVVDRETLELIRAFS
ncbi:MAG: hypothetical protein K5840_01340 [Eubacterium sp.]|nr:hypothetical protein [Eubacterium sp.]